MAAKVRPGNFRQEMGTTLSGAYTSATSMPAVQKAQACPVGLGLARGGKERWSMLAQPDSLPCPAALRAAHHAAPAGAKLRPQHLAQAARGGRQRRRQGGRGRRAAGAPVWRWGQREIWRRRRAASRHRGRPALRVGCLSLGAWGTHAAGPAAPEPRGQRPVCTQCRGAHHFRRGGQRRGRAAVRELPHAGARGQRQLCDQARRLVHVPARPSRRAQPRGAGQRQARVRRAQRRRERGRGRGLAAPRLRRGRRAVRQRRCDRSGGSASRRATGGQGVHVAGGGARHCSRAHHHPRHHGGGRRGGRRVRLAGALPGVL